MKDTNKIGSDVIALTVFMIGCIAPWYSWTSIRGIKIIKYEVNAFQGEFDIIGIVIPNWIMPSAALLLFTLIVLAKNGNWYLPVGSFFAIIVYLFIHSCLIFPGVYLNTPDESRPPTLGIGCFLCAIGTFLFLKSVRRFVAKRNKSEPSMIDQNGDDLKRCHDLLVMIQPKLERPRGHREFSASSPL